MKQNVGTTDRIVRVTLGITILAAGLVFKSWLGLLGLVPLLTGSMGFCPGYCPIRLSTRKDK